MLSVVKLRWKKHGVSLVEMQHFLKSHHVFYIATELRLMSDNNTTLKYASALSALIAQQPKFIVQ